MIVLINYCVPRGQVEIHEFGIVLCHPDDASAVKSSYEDPVDGLEFREALRARDGGESYD